MSNGSAFMSVIIQLAGSCGESPVKAAGKLSSLCQKRKDVCHHWDESLQKRSQRTGEGEYSSTEPFQRPGRRLRKRNTPSHTTDSQWEEHGRKIVADKRCGRVCQHATINLYLCSCHSETNSVAMTASAYQDFSASEAQSILGWLFYTALYDSFY